VTSLSQLKVGDTARVVSVAGQDETAVRLMEMGLTPGVEIQLIGTAPLGDPLEFQVRGYRLSLRRGEAELVAVDTQ
jgi:ferrous iron transport protein A